MRTAILSQNVDHEPDERTNGNECWLAAAMADPVMPAPQRLMKSSAIRSDHDHGYHTGEEDWREPGLMTSRSREARGIVRRILIHCLSIPISWILSFIHRILYTSSWHYHVWVLLHPALRYASSTGERMEGYELMSALKMFSPHLEFALNGLSHVPYGIFSKASSWARSMLGCWPKILCNRSRNKWRLNHTGIVCEIHNKQDLMYRERRANANDNVPPRPICNVGMSVCNCVLNKHNKGALVDGMRTMGKARNEIRVLIHRWTGRREKLDCFPDNWRSGPARSINAVRWAMRLKNDVWNTSNYIHRFDESRSLESKANRRERVDLGFVQVVRQLQPITRHSPLVDASTVLGSTMTREF